MTVWPPPPTQATGVDGDLRSEELSSVKRECVGAAVDPRHGEAHPSQPLPVEGEENPCRSTS